MHGCRYAATARSGSHPESKFPVARQTHLGKKIKVVLADHYEPRAMQIERRFKCRYRSFRARFKSRIEERRINAVLAQNRGRDQRLQRRIGLHLRRLLAVGIEVIAVS